MKNAQNFHQYENGFWSSEPPDPVTAPLLFDGILTRRVIAYAIDVVLLTIVVGGLSLTVGLLSIFTLGLAGVLLAPLVSLVPILYHTLLIASPGHATVGMGFMRIEVHSMKGGYPTLLQAVIMTLLFYISLPFLLLFLVPLFTRRRQALHDILSSTLVVNRSPR